MPYRRHNNGANTTLSCYNVARLRNYVCQSKRIPFAHPNALPGLSTERLHTDLLLNTDSQDTATDESDEQDSSSSERSDDSGPSPNRNNTLLASNNSSPPPEIETWTEPEMGGSIFDSSCESASTASTTSNQEQSDVLMPDQALITLEREVTRQTVESDEPILPSAGTNCENQSSPTNSINNTTCVSANFQKQLDILPRIDWRT